MKKMSGLLLAVACAAPMFLACNGGANAKIETQTDSINYAFGVVNGGGMRDALIGDSADAKKTKKFCDSFLETFNKTLEKEAQLEIEACNFGVTLGREINSGFLFGDSSIVAKKDLLLDRCEKAINGEKWTISTEEAMAYVQSTLQESTQKGEKANLTPEQVDSINMMIGQINGDGVRKYILKADTTKKDIKAFLDNFHKSLDANEDDLLFLQAKNIGSNFTEQLNNSKYLLNDSTIAVNFDAIQRGIIEGIYKDEKAIMTPEEANKYLEDIFAAKAAERNKKTIAEGEAFLKENAKNDSVKVTASGLQYKVIKMGKGAKPTAADTVKVHYHGTLIDGTVFDSTIQRGEPIEFPLGQVIAGWTEGLQLMPIGSKFTFYIPYKLAYGEQGGGQIPPCATLIFDVELIDIVK